MRLIFPSHDIYVVAKIIDGFIDFGRAVMTPGLGVLLFLLRPPGLGGLVPLRPLAACLAGGEGRTDEPMVLVATSLVPGPDGLRYTLPRRRRLLRLLLP